MIFTLQSADEFIEEVRAQIAPPFKPRFRAVSWKEIGSSAIQHSFLVKGLLVNGEKSVMAGESQAGKSFLATDLALAVARGVSFQGHKIPEPRGVVYVCAESAGGVINLRVPAYKKQFSLADDLDLPIQFVVQGPDFYNTEEDAKGLLRDIEHYNTNFSAPLGLIVIDTFSAATPGADENKSSDISRILNRLDDIREATGAHVMVVHHMNAEGNKVRGHTSLVGNFDTVLVVQQTEERDRPEAGGVGRPIRTMTTAKQKDGIQGALRKFILRVVELGTDEDGEPVTSCVCEAPEGIAQAELTQKSREPGMYKIPKMAGIEIATRALANAFKKHGRQPPKVIPSRPRDADVVTMADWRAEMKAMVDPATSDETIRSQQKRITERFLLDDVICKDGDWIWRTRRRIHNVDLPVRHAPSAQGTAPKEKGEETTPSPSSNDPFDELPFA